ncbi:MAG: pyruvate dehydrogenase (acetyl-transferring) E1 component subunit alpha [Planctomycetes bacterium]|nr:pyruvate dehydrogenase (acetyl-transferring) E1 component subunit alpha [Planctomycetota bacterium]NOG53862.1 pyruvate dehydrogenase (acetyl-transferring) E1 component subunit alpha [Planctomycetota bacterium]
MPTKTVYKTSIKNISILDENGKFDSKLGKDVIPIDDAVRLYEHMMRCRRFDEVAFKLQRSGRMGTYPQNWGQEAASAGAAYVLDKSKDWLVTPYRENAGLFWHGLPMEYILWHWMGDERGNQIPEGLCQTPISIPIGTQPLHAVGFAWAAKYRKENAVAVTFFGDGASSEGDVHEALNFATTMKLPMVFCCQNNGWAISTPLERNVAAEVVAQRGLAYGAHCIQCDGNDIFAVVKVMREAVERARNDFEVTFVEMVTYRMGDHTTADDARRYRDSSNLEDWEKKDPLRRLRIYLEAEGAWDDAKQEALEAQAAEHVREVVKTAEGIEAPKTADIFDYTFAELPQDLIEQRERMRTTSIGLGCD